MTSDLTTPNASAMLQMLSRLRRKGAYLDRPPGSADGDWRLSAPGQRRGHGAHITVSSRLVSYARDQGWLVSESDPRRLRLTEEGMLKLSRGLNLAPASSETPLPLPLPGKVTPRGATGSQKGDAPATIARLRRHRDGNGRTILSASAGEAAERLASDFLKGQMMPRVTANWEKAMLGQRPQGMAPGFGIDVRDQIAEAQMRVRRALDDAGGDLAGVLIDVCCFDRGLEDVEGSRGWPRGSGRVILGIALERLARHYGIVTSGPAHGQMTRWGRGDDKPTLDTWRSDRHAGPERDAQR